MLSTQVHNKSNKWSLDFDLLWTFCNVAANHRSDHRHFGMSNFIYFLTTVSATANDVVAQLTMKTLNQSTKCLHKTIGSDPTGVVVVKFPIFHINFYPKNTLAPPRQSFTNNEMQMKF